jgi:REP element-mobilizing transposase RayT
MPRTARASVGGMCYHALNRGNDRRTVFRKEGDFAAFLKAFAEVCHDVPVRPLAYCLMPNHFHLVLWPEGDDDLSRALHRLTTAHVRCAERGRPYGSAGWVEQTAERLGLGSWLRPPGRPRKPAQES